MSPAAAVSLKSAAGWGIFVRRPGVRMACVEGGRGGLYIASGGHEGRRGGTWVNQRRGQGAGVRVRAGAEVFASRRGGREGRAGQGTHLGGGQRLGRGRPARWIMAAAACIIGAALAAVQIPRGCRQSTADTGGVLRTSRSGLRRDVRDIHIGRESSGGVSIALQMGKQCGSGAKAAADCALIHMAREPARRVRIAWAQVRARETGGAAAGWGVKAVWEAGAFMFASRGGAQGAFYCADAVVKATGASFGGIARTARRVEEISCACRRRVVYRTWAAWGAGGVGVVCGRSRSRGCPLPAAFDKDGAGRSKGDSGGTGENAQRHLKPRGSCGLIRKNGLGLKLETARRTGGSDRLLDGKGSGMVIYIEDGGKSQVINGN
ncbi:hypothetical protein B0H13DRAFT_1903137 [Mycena leptocephala]|nr:hypothetical protein B0H13DRAFT_1903137 [Mycena leptocephala]